VTAIQAYVTPDPPAAAALYREALDAARALGDSDLELTALSGLGERLVP
jgi:hypothetical protein